VPFFILLNSWPRNGLILDHTNKSIVWDDNTPRNLPHNVVQILGILRTLKWFPSNMDIENDVQTLVFKLH
jgi:hypothetical protein